MLERMGRWGMNRYLYAPKDDPLHRERWREPYPEPERRAHAELVRVGASHGIEVGFAISPGLSIEYASEVDREALIAKLRGFLEAGARWIVLAVDDVPTRLVHAGDQSRYASLADAHAELVGALRAALGDDLALWLVPTEYLGVEPSPYLEHLGRTLPTDVEVAWTGRTVLSPTVEIEEARARASTLRRRVWLWDNLPVADGPMRWMLHLAPYRGRAPDLPEAVCGVLLNPMQHARASALTLATAAAYLTDPAGYDPEEAWRRAIGELGGAASEAFGLFAEAHRFAPQSDERDRELERHLGALTAALERGKDLSPELDALRRAVDARMGAAEQVRAGLEDRALVAELEPWLESHAVETARMSIALDAATQLLAGGSRSDQLLAYVRMEGRLTRQPAVRAVSYGPRRVLYPQLDSMRDEDMGFASDPSLIRGQCLADEIVDLVADLACFVLTGRA